MIAYFDLNVTVWESVDYLVRAGVLIVEFALTGLF